MESASGTVLPDLLQQSLSLERDFCQALHSSGRTVTALRPPYVDPLVITQKWLIAPDGTPFDAQAFYHAFECACHGVETQEMTIRGDADVLALKESQLILVECKSSPDISEQKLRNLLQRITDVRADMALLLIDTESPDSVERRTRQLCTLLDHSYAEGNRQKCGASVFRWISSPHLYIANTGAGIRATLAAILRLHEAMVQVQSYQRENHV